MTFHGAIDGRTRISWSTENDLVYNAREAIYFFNNDKGSRYLRRLTEPSEGYEDALPFFKDRETIGFFRGTRFEFSFSGEEYEVKTSATALHKVPSGKRIGGENLRGIDQ